MNPRLTDRIAKFPETVAAAKTVDDVQSALVDIERLVLQSNFDDQKAGNVASYEARDYTVGERNTRGLDWKLRLLRVVAEATFCRMIRVGVHGGQTRIIGQPENIDLTIRIFEALCPALSEASATAFTEFSDGQKTEEGAPAVHKAGWINKFLIDQAPAIGATLTESREKDASTNGKLAAMLGDRATALQEYAASLAPAKPVKEPKAPKAKKAPKTATPMTATPDGEVEAATPDVNTGANGVVENTATEPVATDA